ncbi:MAG TPA: hypothetical protein VMV27_05900 [Candidatus Binataceae bacterium]|nr:hypothetical protein [Candidatus Binataceae bacterium]
MSIVKPSWLTTACGALAAMGQSFSGGAAAGGGYTTPGEKFFAAPHPAQARTAAIETSLRRAGSRTSALVSILTVSGMQYHNPFRKWY